MRMKPDWDRLAEEASSDVFIADVHCEDQYDVSALQYCTVCCLHCLVPWNVI